ncbi:hypothetical protein C5B42_05995 [Candidatus Cerribacteria bacterium 'Amazon FNV 2010 28 9']|uniref:Uncharacterized protein n=1 Tax=Candidatus Cerribacteria bacterium 'Amazon FNV 2010 28 9' TaxID=2081795 RepID=A0A317JLL2_9BACT|nr:MAG: hypothetical protein C5B42_05995 [Candidatus Cerribacteria bacterium 'Amazon FNV 2010 28 9']
MSHVEEKNEQGQKPNKSTQSETEIGYDLDSTENTLLRLARLKIVIAELEQSKHIKPETWTRQFDV